MNKIIKNKISELSHRIFKNGVQFSEIVKSARIQKGIVIVVLEGCKHSTDIICRQTEEYQEIELSFDEVLGSFLMQGYKVIASANMNDGNYLNENEREELV